jgi:UDP-N-acetylglucosamine/UDP-N-acetylgalactosamine diphosphorylase
MIKLTSEADKVCVAKVNAAEQSHVFAGWDDLPGETQRALIRQLRSIDLQLVKRLVWQYLKGSEAPTEERLLKPVAVTRLPRSRREGPDYLRYLDAGEEALRGGKVALVTLSGGAGAGPLGAPTGFLPVGPVSRKSLFQLHAEKVRAINLRYRVSLPWTIVVHPDSLEEVQEFFQRSGHFGLNPSDVAFLSQPVLPLVDRRGKIILTERGQLALRPNGHGGVLVDLLKPDNLDPLTSSGVEHLFFFQVNNPLVRVADPIFLGHHLVTDAEVSSKAVPRIEADEELGVFCQFNGSMGVVEYSKLRDSDRTLSGPDGGLAFSSGNAAVHVFSTAFLRRMVDESLQIPFHVFKCSVPHLNRRGERARPSGSNGVEFRCFLFDALWNAQRSSVVEVRREEEFSPIKNCAGEFSVETARRDLSSLYAGWLKSCGATFRDANRDASDPGGSPVVEISPLFALDEDDLAEKLVLPFEVDGPALLGT